MPALRNVAALPRCRSATRSVADAGRKAARPGRRTTSAAVRPASGGVATAICMRILR